MKKQMHTQQYFLFTVIFIIAITMASLTDPSLMVTSSSFNNNGNIPVKYSCEGQQISPPLHITNVPSNTKSLAIILHDPDAPKEGGFTHWVVWNIDPVADIPENFKGGIQGLNGSGKSGYTGMCPPSGTHHYHFMVYAIDTKMNINPSSDKEVLQKAMSGHILASGEIVGLFKKS